MTKRVKRRAITLIEMMIVMFLIAMIFGVVAYNYQGSLDEGKAFKTKANIEKVKNVLSIYLSDHSGANISIDWQNILNASPLVQNGNQLARDGWGEVFEVRVLTNGVLEVRSKKLDEYQKDHPESMFK